ncbi:MAG TPA: NtaA/DmoA family FMN-dependent monooxygenase [Gaiellales bacterium]|jgi:FMN-dependent oxidoreductase (nitrilotriacetate monooxygenase family)
MTSTPAHVLLNLFVAGYGYHEASWKVSGQEHPGTLGLGHFAEIARTAERGMLDSLFFADSPGVAAHRTKFMAQAGYDPIDLLAALAPTTEHIGLLATASTTYSEPWDLARRFATVDHLSDGRAGWNIVTTTSPVAASNFGGRPHPDHADRYARAEEFVEAVVKVWDAWDDDAVVASKQSGIWADPDKLHPPDHRGERFSVAGVLPFPRSPQGRPVMAQAGASDPGVDLAGRFADVVFTPQPSIEAAVAFRERLRASAERHGRPGGAIRALPGLSFVLGSSDAEAEAGWDELQAASSAEFRMLNLAHLAGADQRLAAAVDPDGPFPYELFEQASGKTFGEAVIRTAREGSLTFRQTADKLATLPGGLHFTGTPEGLAELIESWWSSGAADGFTLQPLRLPLDLELFVDHVVPILRGRGIAQGEYAPGTLRDRLGLSLGR